MEAPRASEPGYTRPVVVIQADVLNRGNIRTVVVASLGSNLKWARFPGNVLIPSGASGLPEDSVVNLSQIATLDRSFLRDPVGRLDPGMMRRIDEGLRLVLGLGPDLSPGMAYVEEERGTYTVRAKLAPKKKRTRKKK